MNCLLKLPELVLYQEWYYYIEITSYCTIKHTEESWVTEGQYGTVSFFLEKLQKVVKYIPL